MRSSNSGLPSALIPTDVDSYVVCLAYVVRQLSLINSVFPKVLNSCIPTRGSTYPLEPIKEDKCKFEIMAIIQTVNQKSFLSLEISETSKKAMSK